MSSAACVRRGFDELEFERFWPQQGGLDKDGRTSEKLGFEETRGVYPGGDNDHCGGDRVARGDSDSEFREVS